jgi:hypothetical protein
VLRNASRIKGCAIAASDGPLGSVNDFLFDDASWRLRWMVVDTGKWLSGRKVLLPPSVLGHLDSSGEKFSVRLTMQQVKDSPDIDTNRPVSRQMETSVYDYYGWYPYWGSGFYMGGYGYMPGVIGTSPSPGFCVSENHVAGAHRNDDDPHLRSMAEVIGYHIHATDGEIGHVEDFLVEDTDWTIRFLIVDTKNWWPGKKVLISPASAREIEWSDRLVHLNVDRLRVKASPQYDPATLVDRAYEKRLHTYYGNVQPSDRP